ncbi:MAG: hypothetical protein DUD39_01770 [Coriobacteriaceae bacterium]|nr:MAG: hypothetical protein DUD39_01770 [Coriobacteriaceae bacterium]
MGSHAGGFGAHDVVLFAVDKGAPFQFQIEALTEVGTEGRIRFIILLNADASYPSMFLEQKIYAMILGKR